MDKKQLIVTKNEEKILEGDRSEQDGLHDIPIEKTHIQTNNCRLPSTHAALYHNSTRKQVSHDSNKQQCDTNKQPIKNRNNNIKNTINTTLRQCTHLVHRQQQEDKKNLSHDYEIAAITAPEIKLMSLSANNNHERTLSNTFMLRASHRKNPHGSQVLKIINSFHGRASRRISLKNIFQ